VTLWELLGFPGTVAALLVAGHALGDLVTGPEGRGAQHPAGLRLLAHGAAVLAWHVLALLPLLPGGLGAVLLAALLAAGGHVAVDFLALHRRLPEHRALEAFAGDQALHGVVLLLAGSVLLRYVEPRLLMTRAEFLPSITAVGVVVSAFAFNWGGGGAVVHGVLARLRLPEDLAAGTGDPGVPGSGRFIGILERMILLILVILGQWAGIGFILAAKSLARFRELDSRPFAEYYLVGTLTSLLVAVATGLVVVALR